MKLSHKNPPETAKPSHFQAQTATVRELGREPREIKMPPEPCPHPIEDFSLALDWASAWAGEYPPRRIPQCTRCGQVLR